MKRKVFMILGVLLALVPLGLLTESPAWGEWDNEYYQKVLGFVPQGIKNSFHFQTFMSDYSVKGVGDVAGYYISALTGLILIFAVYFILVKIFGKKSDGQTSSV